MNKHAYLIMAHNNFENLKILLKLIDDERNDIYIHFDKKVTNINIEEYKKICLKSNVYCYSEIEVYWGHESQVLTELFLLEQAIKNKYEYYHLLSGADLPIKSNDYIYNFFAENKGKEFINFTEKNVNRKTLERVNKYHFFQKQIAKHKGILKYIFKILELVSIKIQYIFRINRTKKMTIQKGANWFSITDDLARFVISKKEWIHKTFKNTLCADEVFLQTIVENSEYKERLYKKLYSDNYDDCMREIDWKRGGPYIYKIDDFEMLMNSNKLWARKFDYKTDDKIIIKIYDNIEEIKWGKA